MKILLHLFEFAEVYLIISFGSDPVRELHGPLVQRLKLVWRSSLTEWPAIQIPWCHKTYIFQMSTVSHKTYLSRKYEANILLRIHNSKNIILCPSNKNTKCVYHIFIFYSNQISRVSRFISKHSRSYLSLLNNSKRRKRVKRKGLKVETDLHQQTVE